MFAALSRARAFVTYEYHPSTVVGLILTALMYALPGLLVGALEPRRPIRVGAALAVLTLPVVLYVVSLPVRELRLLAVAEVAVGFLVSGMLFCVAGSVAGQYVRAILRDL